MRFSVFEKVEEHVNGIQDNKIVKLPYLITLLIVIWAVGGLIVFLAYRDPNDRGTFGDMFGTINALFSGLAFAGIIYTIFLQRIELRYQRNEIAKSTAELAGQKEQMTIQRFEHSFFSLLSIQNEIVSNVDYNSVKGRMVFYKLHSDLHNYYSDSKDEVAAFSKLYSNYHYVIEHYSRNLITIVRFVNSSELCADEKRKYVGFLKSQISSYELVIFFYYCFDRQEILILLKKYDFFDSINTILLLNKNRFEQLLHSINLGENLTQ